MNFADLPSQYSNPKDSVVVIVPVPYDETSTWIKGADKGPAAILNASANMELYDIETDSEVYKKGIFTDKPVKEKSSPENMVKAVYKRVSSHLDNGKFVVTLGGEHSISIGAIKAHADRCDNLTILQFDAHTDLRQQYHGSKCNHACVMARAQEYAPILQVAIRSTYPPEETVNYKNVFLAEDIVGSTKWMDKALAKLNDNVYITFDLDAFDPSIMPSTGTPEPGGLLWYECLTFLKAVISKKNLIGFDIVELCPNKINKAPDFLTAKLIYKMLSYKFEK